MSQQSGFFCPECNSSEIIIEDFNNVCSNCGNIINENPELVNQPNINVPVDFNQNKTIVTNPHLKKYWNFGSKNKNHKKPTLPVQFGIDLIYSLCKNLNISKRICEIAINLFKDVASDEEFKYCCSKNKQCLALCCLYMISNQENNPMTLTELAQNSDCLFNHIGVVLLRLQKIRPQILQNDSRFAECLVPLYLFKHDFDEKEKITISELATQLVWMMRQALLIQGLNPISIIYAALFYSWKAIDPNRAKISLKKFCDKFNIKNTKILYTRVNFMLKVLIDFIKCCPLLSDDDQTISKDTITMKLENIISMKHVILLNYNQKSLDEAKRKSSSTSKSCRNENEANDNIQQKTKNYAQDDNLEEFSDSEIDLYIRTEQEISELKKLKNVF